MHFVLNYEDHHPHPRMSKVSDPHPRMSKVSDPHPLMSKVSDPHPRMCERLHPSHHYKIVILKCESVSFIVAF